MQKQAKIDFSNPKVKKIVWNLKHFNREYKVAYNISILIISTNLILLGGITWGSINFSLGVSCRYDPFAWIFFGGYDCFDHFCACLYFPVRRNTAAGIG